MNVIGRITQIFPLRAPTHAKYFSQSAAVLATKRGPPKDAEKEKARKVAEKEKERARKAKDAMKTKLSPPKQPPTPWQLFFIEELHKARQQGKVEIGVISHSASELYKNLTDSEKQPYIEQSKELRAKQAKEFADYIKSLPYEVLKKENSLRTKLRKQGKKGGVQKIRDPNAPKRPLTAYFTYLKDLREKEDLRSTVFGGDGSRWIESSIIEQSKSASDKWKQLSEDFKQTYKDRATEAKKNYEKAKTQKSKWSSLEFRVYYAVFLVMIPIIFYIPMQMSTVQHTNYSRYSGRLAKGWLFGRGIDLTDQQYKSFRNNLSHLVFISATHVILSRLLNKIKKLTQFDSQWILCLAVLVGLHSSQSIFPLAVSIASYALSKLLAGYRHFYAFIWTVNILSLVAIEYYNGISFSLIHPALAHLNSSRGLVRWHVFYKMTMLRNISFALDLHWMRTDSKAYKPIPPRGLSYSERKNVPLSEQDYDLSNFIHYAFYPPLYLAGPIITFNDFVHQTYAHFKPPTVQDTLKYALRCLSSFLTLEITLHYIYVVAIKNTGAWRNDTPAEIALIGFWNLIVVWLKLLIPWRYFRLWSLADGIDCPENMIRCVANNYSTTGFWRSWHRSFNLWIIRYLYIPLGGTRYTALITPVIFVFVALWHDLNWRLLVWGGLASAIILPELLASHLLPAQKYGHRRWYRHVCAAGGVLNILALMGANLVGFVLGIRNTKNFLVDLISTVAGWRFLAIALPSLFVGVQVMFELRESEKRRGVFLRC